MFVLNLKKDYQSGLVVDENIFFALEANTLFSEINNVLNAEGVVPDEAKLDQLNTAIDLKIKRLTGDILKNYYTKDEVYNKQESEAKFALKQGDSTTTFNVADPTAQSHATNKKYVDGEILKVRNDLAPIDNLTSTLTNKPLSANMGRVLKDLVDKRALMNGDTNQNFFVKEPTQDAHATTKKYVDKAVALKAEKEGDDKIPFKVGTPASPTDATTKKYVDDLVNKATVKVEDTLTSTSTKNALSANQGRVLKEEVDLKESSLGRPENDGDVLISNQDGTRSWVPRVKDSQLLEGKSRASIISETMNNIIDGADGAYDTLKEIEKELKSNDADIAKILSGLATKANKTGDNTLNFKVKAPVANDDATTKKYVDEKVSGSVVTIENVLTSTNTKNGLSANMGRVVNNDLQTHKGNKNNPHAVTKAQVGLGNVDNTSDLNKPISNATQTALNNKADKTGDNTVNFKVKDPVADDDASTKKYVDGKISAGATTIVDNLTTNSSTSALSANMGRFLKYIIDNNKADKTGDNTVNFKVKAPVADDDAVTKKYVDDNDLKLVVQGVA